MATKTTKASKAKTKARLTVIKGNGDTTQLPLATSDDVKVGARWVAQHKSKQVYVDIVAHKDGTAFRIVGQKQVHLTRTSLDKAVLGGLGRVHFRIASPKAGEACGKYAALTRKRAA